MWLTVHEAGYPTTTWYPGGLIVLALLGVALVALPPPRPSRLTLAAIVLLGGYAAWSLLSIAWAPDQGVAWTGANRTIVFAALFALFALWPMRGSVAQILAGLYGLAVVAIALVVLLKARGAEDPSVFFADARLDEPAGYVNANVALWFLGFWACVLFAARRETPALLRGVYVGGAALLVGTAMLGQSRSWLFALPAMLLLSVLVGPNRGRILVVLGLLAAAAGVMWEPALGVYDGTDPGDDLSAPLAGALGPIFGASAVLLVLGVAAGLLDRRVAVGPRTARTLERLAVGGALIAVLAALTVVAALVDRPVDRVSEYWESFSRVDPTGDSEARRLTGPPTGNRYDYWQVAVELFADRPLTGFGADNFQQQYLVRGQSSDQPRYTHSLELRVLAHTGLVGAALLGGALLLGFATAGRALRGGARNGAAITAAAGILMAAYWILHGSLDWLWEFPALTGAALAMLGLGAAAADASRDRPPRRRLLRAGGLVACVAAALALIPAWLAELETRNAARAWQQDPPAAQDRLERAAAINPVSDFAYLAAGAVAVQMGDLELAEERFRAARERNPGNFYAHLQLGAIASEQGQRQTALRHMRRAVELNPRDDPTRRALRLVRRGDRLEAASIRTQLLRDRRARIGG